MIEITYNNGDIEKLYYFEKDDFDEIVDKITENRLQSICFNEKTLIFLENVRKIEYVSNK